MKGGHNETHSDSPPQAWWGRRCHVEPKDSEGIAARVHEQSRSYCVEWKWRDYVRLVIVLSMATGKYILVAHPLFRLNVRQLVHGYEKLIKRKHDGQQEVEVTKGTDWEHWSHCHKSRVSRRLVASTLSSQGDNDDAVAKSRSPALKRTQRDIHTDTGWREWWVPTSRHRRRWPNTFDSALATTSPE